MHEIIKPKKVIVPDGIDPDGNIRNYTPNEWKRLVRLLEYEYKSPKEIIQDSLQRNDNFPEVVYHYTDHQGLMGILDQSKIWATKVGFLNDKDELHYGLKLLQEAILTQKYSDNEQQLSPEQHGLRGLINTTIDFMLTEVRPSSSYDLYTVSFCGERDLSSAWHAYGGCGNGYAIGFYAKHLFNAADSLNFEFHQVFYEKSKIMDLVHVAFTTALKGLSERLWDERFYVCANMEWFSYQVWHALLPLIPFFKKPHWKDEREYRVLLTEIGRSLKTRLRDSQEIPFLEFSFYSTKAPQPFHYLPIAEVITGSKISKELALEAEVFAEQKGYDEIPFSLSEVNFS